MSNPCWGRAVAWFSFVALVSSAPDAATAQSVSRVGASVQEYAVDAGHSIVEFSIGFALSRVKGRFTQWKGTILYDSLDPGNSSISVVIETKSIDTGWPHRDQHLRTSDFFDVEKFPTIVFQSQRLERRDTIWIATGPLTMHGVTKTVAIPFRLGPAHGSPARDSISRNMLLTAVGAVTIARTDFGLLGGSTFNSWFNKARSATMSDSVSIDLEVEAWLSDATTLRYATVEAALQRVRANGLEAYIHRVDSLHRTLNPTDWARTYRGPDWLARVFLGSGNSRDALALTRSLTEWYPDVPSAYAMRGLALAAAGDTVGAAQQYARARRTFVPPVRDPNEPFPQDDENWYYLDHLVRSALEWKLQAQAAALAQLVADLYPDIARAHATLGRALAVSGRLDRASAEFDRAQAIDPWDTRTMEWRRRFGLKQHE